MKSTKNRAWGFFRIVKRLHQERCAAISIYRENVQRINFVANKKRTRGSSASENKIQIQRLKDFKQSNQKLTRQQVENNKKIRGQNRACTIYKHNIRSPLSEADLESTGQYKRSDENAPDTAVPSGTPRMTSVKCTNFKRYKT